MKRILSAVAGLALLVPAGAGAQSVGDTSVFARIGDPGMPEGIAVRDGKVYVGTHVSVRGNGGAGPSKIFVFDLATAEPIPTETITIAGQNTTATHGILALVFGPDDALYVLDRNPPRMLRIDVATGNQSVYASLPDLPACRPVAGPDTDCAPVTVDEPAFPDYFAFGPDGSAYVTDLQAATIFRVPPGGNAAQIWFQDPRLDGIFGANGIAIGPDGDLYFAMTGSQQPATPGQGIIYRLPLVASPAAEDLEAVFTYLEPAAGPDGIAFGASGKLYVALAGHNQVSILDAKPRQVDAVWTELARFPETPVENATQEVPYDLPASIAFDGDGSILVTNQSFFAANPSNWAVLRAYVGDSAA